MNESQILFYFFFFNFLIQHNNVVVSTINHVRYPPSPIYSNNYCFFHYLTALLYPFKEFRGFFSVSFLPISVHRNFSLSNDWVLRAKCKFMVNTFLSRSLVNLNSYKTFYHRDISFLSFTSFYIAVEILLLLKLFVDRCL